MKREKISKEKKEFKQGNHLKNNPESLLNKFYSQNETDDIDVDTPFYPRAEEHSALLEKARTSEQATRLLLRLQRSYGNAYVQRLVMSSNIQTKLKVSDPGDMYEQEADRIAEEVTRSINTPVQRQGPEEEELLQGKSLVQRQAEPEEEEEVQAKSLLQRQAEPEEEEEIQAKSLLQRQAEPEEEEEIQAKSLLLRQAEPEEEEVQIQLRDDKATTVANEIETRINNTRSDGHPLSEDVKQPMEQAFKADFNDVKIHTDTEANTLNKQLNAKAFTTGQDIFFRDGEYSPSSESGKKLLAHELTHVVQQTGNKTSENSVKPSINLTDRMKTTYISPLADDNPITVQREWDWREVQDILAKTNKNLDNLGIDTSTYTLVKMNTLTWREKRYKKRWWSDKLVDTKVHNSKGYHDKQLKQIGISNELDNNAAAATLVHEAKHADQYRKAELRIEPLATLLNREIEAHMEEENFRHANGMNPKTFGVDGIPDEYQILHTDKGVDRASVEKFVRWRYDLPSLQKGYYIKKEPNPRAANFTGKEYIDW